MRIESKAGTERKWQAEQGTVQIEWRQPIAPGDDLSDARDRSEQRLQRPRRFEDDFCAALRDEGGVADELNGIAISLLGVE